MQTLFNTKVGDLPISEDILSRHICLPIHPRMTSVDVNRVVDVVQSVICNF